MCVNFWKLARWPGLKQHWQQDFPVTMYTSKQQSNCYSPEKSRGWKKWPEECSEAFLSVAAEIVVWLFSYSFQIRCSFQLSCTHARLLWYYVLPSSVRVWYLTENCCYTRALKILWEDRDAVYFLYTQSTVHCFCTRLSWTKTPISYYWPFAERITKRQGNTMCLVVKCIFPYQVSS